MDEENKEKPPVSETQRRLNETKERVDENTQKIRRMEVAFEYWVPYWLRWQEIDWTKGAELAAVVSHTIIVVALVAAAVAITLTGSDATLVWGLIGGYVGGSAVQKVTQRVTQVPPQ